MSRCLSLCALVVAVSVAVSGLVTHDSSTSNGRHVIRKGPRPDGPAEYVTWRNLSLRDETGQIAPDGLMRAKAHVDAMRAYPNPPSGAGISRGSWSPIGPGNVGGRVRAIVIHPTNVDTMFAGSVSGGIWKTTNGGASWLPVDDFMTNLAVAAIVMAPGDPNLMFAATGEGFYNADRIRGAGIFKSTDGGLTWAQLPATSSAPGAGQSAADYYYMTELALSPTGTLLATSSTGIFRSTDNGDTFTRATMVGGSPIAVANGIVDVKLHPTDSTRAVAGTFSGTALYSSDGGATWTLATGLPASSTFQRVELAFAPSNGNVVYASVDLNGGAIYKSIDAGQSYAVVYNGSVDALGAQGWYDNLIWIDPTDENLLVWGGIDLWRSVNGGTSFSQMSRWQAQALSGPTSAHADHHVAVPHPNYNGTSNRIVFFGNDGGVYRATDVTTTGASFPHQSGWTELNNGLAITQFYGGAGHAGTGKITGGTQDNGTLFYDPAVGSPSENWTSPFGGDGGFSAYDSVDANYFYGEYVYLQLHRNTTGGASPSDWIDWNLPDAGSSSACEFIAAFILDPNNNDRLLGACVRLWRTNAVKAGIPSFESIKAAVGTDKISAVAVAPGNSDIIYAGHNAGRLYKTTVGTSAAATVAASWTTIDDNSGADPLPNRRITRITIDPSNNDVVYVTLGGFSADNIYKSVNGGTSWTDITGPSGGPTALPHVPVRDLEIHPTNSNWLYAGTEVGIFTSEDGGATWMLPHDGPSNASVDELFFMGTTLVAVTHGRGMFATPTAGGPMAPTAVNDNYATAHNTTLNVTAPGVLGNDNTHGGGAMTAQLVGNVANGVLSLNADGSFTYTPTTGFSGNDSFTYQALNSVGLSNVATVSIAVASGAAAPTAVNDNYATPFNTPLNVAAPGLLGNDNSNGGGAMTAQLVGNVANGTLGLNADGSFTYTPTAGFSGNDSFSYQAVNSVGASNVATVSIVVGSGGSAPIAANDNYSTPFNTLLNVAAPGVLGNDLGGPPMTAQLVDDVTNGTLVLNAAGGFTYTPDGGFSGNDTFTYRASNPGGLSNVATVTLSVGSGPATVQPPTGLYASAISGNLVTLRWTPPASGLTPTDYILEGGIAPGEVLASIATGGTAPVFTFSAPSGSFHVRIHTVAGAERSVASNEILIHVNVPVPPSPPANLLAMVNGSALALAWRNTAAGGAPTAILLDVSGSLAATLPLPATESFSFGGVPPGTYTLSLRAANGAGTSGSSNPVTVTFPGACSGAPQVPTNFVAYRTGNQITVLWDLPAGGPAPTAFVLDVSGTFVASLPTTQRSISGVVGPGSYTFTVYASNPCGSGPATTSQTVVVP